MHLSAKTIGDGANVVASLIADDGKKELNKIIPDTNRYYKSLDYSTIRQSANIPFLKKNVRALTLEYYVWMIRAAVEIMIRPIIALFGSTLLSPISKTDSKKPTIRLVCRKIDK